MKSWFWIFLMLLAPSLCVAAPARVITGKLLRSQSIGPSSPVVPSGIVYLTAPGQMNSAILGLPDVDGVVVGTDWFDIEPTTQGVYVYNVATQGQPLDSILTTVVNADAASRAAGGLGKWMRFTIATGGMGKTAGGHKPDWLIPAINADSYASTKLFSWNDGNPCGQPPLITVPVHWEPTLLSAHLAMIQATADHIRATNPAAYALIKVVLVPLFNTHTNDYDPGSTDGVCVDGVAPLGSTPKSRWISSLSGTGFASMAAGMKSAAATIYAGYRAAFPEKILSTSIGRLDDVDLNPGTTTANHGRHMYEEILAAANAISPGYIMCQKQNLNCNLDVAPNAGTTWNDLYLMPYPHSAQNVWHVWNDGYCFLPDGVTVDQWTASRMNGGIGGPCTDATGCLKKSMETGLTYNTYWQEIYALDLQNMGTTNGDPHIPVTVPPTPRDIIHYGHQLLYRP